MVNQTPILVHYGQFREFGHEENPVPDAGTRREKARWDEATDVLEAFSDGCRCAGYLLWVDGRIIPDIRVRNLVHTKRDAKQLRLVKCLKLH